MTEPAAPQLIVAPFQALGRCLLPAVWQAPATSPLTAYAAVAARAASSAAFPASEYE